MSNAMSYKGYKASMVFDAEDKVIVGRVLEIDDIISFHAESVSEFEAGFHAAIDAYVAACAELGGKPEKPASGKLMLRIAPEVHAAALKAAARSGVSLNKSVNALYPSVHLFNELDRIAIYPDGVVAVPCQIPGLAFFPGGRGVYQKEGCLDLPTFPVGGVMIVGQDFDNVDGFNYSLKQGEENRASVPTWRNLLGLLDRCQIPKTACFFTNAYMGLRATGKNTGPSPGTRHAEFRAMCEEFFSRQLAMQLPRLLLALGMEVANFIARCSPNLHGWAAKDWKSLDSSNSAIVFDARIEAGGFLLPAAVALTHPSYRPKNVLLRRYHGLRGDSAEQALLADAVVHAGGFELYA